MEIDWSVRGRFIIACVDLRHPILHVLLFEMSSPMAESQASSSEPNETEHDAKNSSQFVGFQIADQQYAFRIEQIQEIVILDQITATPQVANCVDGVTNLRGQIIPVINLRKLLGIEPLAYDAETRMIVLNVGERQMGCTVDSVSQVIRIPRANIQPSLDTVTADGNHDVAGFAKLGDNFYILLDIDELFRPERLKSVPIERE